jgi:hypothetical protein
MSRQYEPYTTALEQSLIRANMDGVQIQAIVAKFLVNAARTNPARALVEAVENYANEDGYLLLQSLVSKSKIEQALEKLSTEHPYTKLTPRERIQRSIEKIKQNKNALDWELVLDERDKKNLTSNQLEALQKAEHERKNPKPVEIPSCFASTTQFKGRSVTMELQVKK